MSFRSDTGWKKGIFGLEENVDVEEERESRYASLEFEFSRCLFEFDDLYVHGSALSLELIPSISGPFAIKYSLIRGYPGEATLCAHVIGMSLA